MKRCVMVLLVLVVWCGGVSAGNPFDNNELGKNWKNIDDWTVKLIHEPTGVDKIFYVKHGAVFTISNNDVKIEGDTSKVKYRIINFSKVKIDTTITHTLFPRKNINYYIKTSELTENTIKEGKNFIFGLLTVPFKLYITEDNDIKPGGLIGIAGGFNVTDNSSIIGSVINSKISIPNEFDDNTEEIDAVSLAVGWIYHKHKAFQIGFIGGFDFVGGDAGDRYDLNKEPWVTATIGVTLFDY